MKRGGGVHTVPAKDAGGWWNKVNGLVLSRHRLKKAAVTKGRAIARKRAVEHTIHRGDGVISAKNSYGNDPYPPRDSA
jgi:hypothetical protein